MYWFYNDTYFLFFYYYFIYIDTFRVEIMIKLQEMGYFFGKKLNQIGILFKSIFRISNSFIG